MLFRLATTMVGTNEDERFTEETAGFANEEVPSWSFGTIATRIETDLCVLDRRVFLRLCPIRCTMRLDFFKISCG